MAIGESTGLQARESVSSYKEFQPRPTLQELNTAIWEYDLAPADGKMPAQLPVLGLLQHAAVLHQLGEDLFPV